MRPPDGSGLEKMLVAVLSVGGLLAFGLVEQSFFGLVHVAHGSDNCLGYLGTILVVSPEKPVACFKLRALQSLCGGVERYVALAKAKAMVVLGSC